MRQNSQPVGLLTKEGTLYMLMPEEHDPRRDGGVDIGPRRPITWATSWKSPAPRRRTAAIARMYVPV